MTAYVRAGRIDKRVRVYRYNPQAARNPDGGLMPALDQTYVFIGTVWAAIEARSGSERLSDGRIQAQQTHEILMRTNSQSAGLRERDRIVYTTGLGETRKYDILSQIDEDEESRRTRLSARYVREPEGT